METCPVCGGRASFPKRCDSCGFDPSCDYERYRTLSPVLPKFAEPVSARAAKRKRQQQTVTVPAGDLRCPKCGGAHLLFLVDELKFMCPDCGAKNAITILTETRPADIGKTEAYSPVQGGVFTACFYGYGYSDANGGRIQAERICSRRI